MGQVSISREGRGKRNRVFEEIQSVDRSASTLVAAEWRPCRCRRRSASLPPFACREVYALCDSQGIGWKRGVKEPKIRAVGAAAVRSGGARARGGDRAAVGRTLAAAPCHRGGRLFLPWLRGAGPGGAGDCLRELAALPQAARRRRRQPNDRGEHRAASHPDLPDRADHAGRELRDHGNPAMGWLGGGDQPQRRADARLDRATARRRGMAERPVDCVSRASRRHRRDHPTRQRRQYRQHLPWRGGGGRPGLQSVSDNALHADRAVLHLSRRRGLRSTGRPARRAHPAVALGAYFPRRAGNYQFDRDGHDADRDRRGPGSRRRLLDRRRAVAGHARRHHRA